MDNRSLLQGVQKVMVFGDFKLVDFDPFGVFLCFNEGSLFLNFNFRVFSRVIFF